MDSPFLKKCLTLLSGQAYWQRLLGNNFVSFVIGHPGFSIASGLYLLFYISYIVVNVRLHTPVATSGQDSLVHSWLLTNARSVLYSWSHPEPSRISLVTLAALLDVAATACYSVMLYWGNLRIGSPSTGVTWLGRYFNTMVDRMRNSPTSLPILIFIFAVLLNLSTVFMVTIKLGYLGLRVLLSVGFLSFWLRALLLLTDFAVLFTLMNTRSHYWRAIKCSLGELGRVINWTAFSFFLTILLCGLLFPFMQIQEALRILFSSAPVLQQVALFFGTFCFSLSTWYSSRTLLIAVQSDNALMTTLEQRGASRNHLRYWGEWIPRFYGLIPFCALAWNLYTASLFAGGETNNIEFAIAIALVLALVMWRAICRPPSIASRGLFPSIYWPILFVLASYLFLTVFGTLGGFVAATTFGTMAALTIGLAGINVIGTCLTQLRVQRSCPVLSALLAFACVLSFYNINDNHLIRDTKTMSDPFVTRLFISPAPTPLPGPFPTPSVSSASTLSNATGRDKAMSSPPMSSTQVEPAAMESGTPKPTPSESPFDPRLTAIFNSKKSKSNDANVEALTEFGQTFGAWLEQRRDKKKNERYPVVLVAAEGGGIRAAAEVALTLAYLEDRLPGFRDHVFAVSGVSGGSVGAATYAALCKEASSQTPYPILSSTPAPTPSSKKRVATHWVDTTKTILGQDMLAPPVAALLHGDFLQWFYPFPIKEFDRAAALDQAYEATWQKAFPTSDSNLLKASFYSYGGDLISTTRVKRTNSLTSDLLAGSGVPALFFNTTRLDTGDRMVLSTIPSPRLSGVSTSKYLTTLNQVSPDASPPLSTAAFLSARFPYISPYGTIPISTTSNGRSIVIGHKRFVDGGYFENSGAATLTDIVRALQRIRDSPTKAETASNAPRFRIIVLRIGFDYSEVAPDANPSNPIVFAELLTPPATLYQARDGRARVAVMQLEAAVNSFGAAEGQNPSSMYKEVVFKQNPESPQLPLGWLISPTALDEILAQVIKSNVKVDVENFLHSP